MHDILHNINSIHVTIIIIELPSQACFRNFNSICFISLLTSQYTSF